jgi:hypothetical protein
VLGEGGAGCRLGVGTRRRLPDWLTPRLAQPTPTRRARAAAFRIVQRTGRIDTARIDLPAELVENRWVIQRITR